MTKFAALAAALVLGAGVAHAAGPTDPRDETPTVPFTAAQPVQVKAADVLSAKELARAGLAADAEITVSDFTAPGPRTTYTR